MSTPRQRRYDLTRQKILDSARKIIVTQGLSSLSMRLLAESIDYSPSAIYKYFHNKEEILNAIRAEGWELSAKLSAGAIPDDLPPPEKLLASGRAYLDFADTYPEHYLLMFNSPDLPDIGVSDMSQDPRFSGVVAYVQEGIDSGHFVLPEGFDALLMAFHLWITCHGAAMLHLTLMRNFRDEFDPLVDKLMTAHVNSFTVKERR